MQTTKLTRTWALAGAVAAMLAASPVVRAQDTNNPTPAPGAVTPSTIPGAGTTNTTDTTGTSTTGTTGTGTTSSTDTTSTTSTSSGSMSTGSMSSGSMSGGMSSGMMDYHILSNPNYDYIDLMQAKARGLSDSQIATISKISRESLMPFGFVARRVEAGATFPTLATEYNLKLADVYSNEKEKQQIADYISTYESIGTKSGSSGGMMDMGMDKTMSMDKTMPMAAETTTSTTTTTTSTTTTPMATTPMATPTGSMDIVDTAMAAKNLTTLVKAIQTAGLVETLKGAGPFTVFAPDDKAFSRLPSGTLDSLMADPAKLKQVLEYHVIPASIDAQTAMSMTSPTSPPTVEGSTLQVTKGRRGRLRVNNATVTKPNIGASNGIIHVIDRVLLPPMDASGNIIPAGSTTGTGTTGTDTTGTGATGTGAGTTGAGAGTTGAGAGTTGAGAGTTGAGAGTTGTGTTTTPAQ